jgi:hypothetical protein
MIKLDGKIDPDASEPDQIVCRNDPEPASWDD